MKPKPKPSEMSPEVRSMIDLRHAAEQRGHFQPLGRLLTLVTAHGEIKFPAEGGEGTGPDLALGMEGFDENPMRAVLVLGPWLGLPLLRHNSTMPCPKCRRDCDMCDGKGKKQCEGYQCGGRGWIPGPLEDCPGEGCKLKTQHFNPACTVCGGHGQVPPREICKMCEGSGVMTCSRCRGTKKFSTGYIGGAMPESEFKVPPKCKACDGTAWKGEWVAQELEKFANATMQTYKHNAKYPKGAHGPGCGKDKVLLALGPIYSFVLQEFSTGRIKTFEVAADAKGDLLFLLVPAGKAKHPKAYLVGGVVKEQILQKRA